MISIIARQLGCKETRMAVVLDLIDQLKINKELAFETDTNNDTLLHYAVKYDGTSHLIEELVKCGVHLKSKNKQGNTALHIAAAHSIQNAALLMQLGARDNVINNDALLPEDIFHQTFKNQSWFDIMPTPKIIFKGSRYEIIPSQNHANVR